MKKLCSALCAMMLLATLFSSLVLPVQAADWEYTFYGTVGETAYFIITSNPYDEIQEAKIYNGVVPGMELDVAGGATLGLAGVPTTDGEFKVFITLKTRDLGTVDIKVTVYINPAEPSSDGVPVVTKNPTNETVVEGDSAAFIARADNTRQYCWQIAIADAVMDVQDLPSYIGQGVKVSGWDTEKLVIENIPETLDGAYIWCQFVGAEQSVDSTAAVLTVVPIEDASPVVTKHPGSEIVEEGGSAVFTAEAKYAQEYLWQLITPEGNLYDCDRIQQYFPGLEVAGATTGRITLSNIPMELNGSRIRCLFTAGYTTASDYATLTVTEKPEEPTTQPPTEEPTEAVTEEPTEAVTEESAEVPDEEKPANHDSDEDEEERSDPDDGGEDNTLLIVIIISTAVVAIAGIAAFTVLKLKGKKEQQ